MLRFLTKAAPTGMPPALSSVRPALAKSDGGSAFLDLFLPSLRNQGLEGPPHRVPDFYLPNLQDGGGEHGPNPTG